MLRSHILEKVDIMYYVPIGLRNKHINSEGFEFEATPITIFLGLSGNVTCYEHYQIAVLDYKGEVRKKILVNIYNGNLNQIYNEITEVIHTVVDDM